MPGSYVSTGNAVDAIPKFPVKDHLVHEYHLGNEWDLQGCSCLQMSDASIWFVVPNADQRKWSSSICTARLRWPAALFRSVHCIEFAPSGHRIRPHTGASNMPDEEEEEIDVSAI